MNLRPGAWTLRRRLVLGLVALLAAVSVVVGVVSVLALQSFLRGQVDEQLVAAADRTPAGDRSPTRPLQPPSRDGPPAFVPGQGDGTLLARIAPAGTRAAVLRAGAEQQLPAATAAALGSVPVGVPTTVDLGGSLGDYRVLARERPGPGVVLVTGVPLGPVQETVRRLVAVVTVVTLLGLVVAAVVGALVVRLGLRPLRRVTDTARRVAELPLDRGEVALAERVPPDSTDPRTEVGSVGAALNAMLEHVAAALRERQASEMRVRTFVGDASHELRTPLASIRGYAEITRPYRSEVPPDVGRALERVESEAVRMSGLVEDLLLLTRLDAVPDHGRPWADEPVDLSALVVDSVGDAHAAARDHRWALRLPEQPVVVRGDPARLRQVLANLLANARTHTPPGTRVEVELSEPAGPGGGVRLVVRDDGPGIPPELLPEVFGRFVRGDSSRSRAQGSTGLGLALVDAIVAAHGGRATARSVPGRTEFVVELPGAAAGHDAAPAQRVDGAPGRSGTIMETSGSAGSQSPISP